MTQDEDGRGVFGLPDSAFEVLMLANDTNNGLSGFMGTTAVDEAPSGTYRLMLQFDPVVPGLLKSWTNLLMQVEVTDSAQQPSPVLDRSESLRPL